MAGYTRQDIANNISNGNVIDADDLDNEFNALAAAFSNSSGHTHDGTAENGAPITVVGPTQDIVVSVSQLRPKSNNTVDLGTTGLRYKDFYLAGNSDIDGTMNVAGATALGNSLSVGTTLSVTSDTTVGGNLDVTGNITVDGNATIAGNLTFGDAATDTVAFSADVNSNIIPSADDTYDLGAVGSEWRNLYVDGTANIDTASVDSLTATTADINGGTLDNVVIGGNTEAAATFTTVDTTGNVSVGGALTVTGAINGTATSANTLATARTIALSGDVSGSASFNGSSNITITATVADDSHNHTIANVDGLQTALDALQASSTALTTSTTFGGDVSGTYNNIVIADDSHNHIISNVDGLQTELDSLQTAINGKAATSHTHAISDVTNLQTSLDAKAPLASPTFTGTVTVNSTTSIVVPVGSTAQRPGTPSNGMLRYNSDDAQFEGYADGAWGAIAGGGGDTQTATTTSTTETSIATYTASTSLGIEITVVATDTVATERTITKLLVTHDGTTAVATQYGEVNTATAVASYDVDISGGNVRLLATAASTNSTNYTASATILA